jgi:2-methylaconitate cis-trans-isomerase PrpF
LTGALCLAAATRVPGSIPNEMARRLMAGVSQIRIAHASGLIVVDAKIELAKGDGNPHAEYAAVYRTARRLFDGRVHYRAEN